MTDVFVVVVAIVVFVPWLLVALWASLRFRRGEKGALAVAMVLPRIAVFLGLAVVLCTIAAVGLYFWANIAAEAPLVALIAHGVSMLPAYWVAKQQKLPFDGTADRVARVVVFVGAAFWLPLFVLVIGALAYEAL